VSFTAAPDAGELDAGFDDAGNASMNICNPITNAGCTGTDWCGTDNNSMFWVCGTAGTPANVALCGDCTAQAATCAPGELCITQDGTNFSCAQLCCTNADCAPGKCATNVVQGGLPNNVGLCIQ
jgi:hypothetical protein